MNSINPIAFLACVLVAIVSASVLALVLPPPSEKGRYASIDGLRGLLALFVFIHHGAHWYDYLRTGDWVNPPSRLYANIGTGAVVLFFLVSGFLFIGKIADKRAPIDWRKLYVHRFFRLVPLYVVAIVLLLSIVFVVSDGRRLDSLSGILESVLTWSTFTVFGQPPINTVPTFDITSGVTWSLTFEWFFYLCLPLLALAMGRRVSVKVVVVTVAALLIIGAHLDDGRRFLAFAGAPIAVYAVQFAFMRKASSNYAASVVAIAFISIALLAFDGPYERMPLLLLSAAFVLIACGCDLFGLLTTRWALYLGELAYSMYLLHGLLLYVVFKLLAGPAVMAALSSNQYWWCVIGLTPVIVFAATLTFRFVERPGIAAGVRTERWLAARFGSHPPRTLAEP